MKKIIATKLKENHQLISGQLEKYLRGSASDFAKVNGYAEDLVERLLPMTTGGKMIRGSLVLMAYQLWSGEEINAEADGARQPDEAALEMAQAVELFHTAFVIHDDIMDGDEMRRGQPAIHAAYRQALGDHERARGLGEALAICLGDLAMFLGFAKAARAQTDQLSPILVDLAREYQLVGLGQMGDVSSVVEEIDRAQTLSIYRYKTARYTFSLPLKLGAWLAGADEATRQRLTAVGENLGLIYQIRDDYLNIYGEPGKTGKPVGSDIRENKQTLMRSFLFEAVTGAERVELEMIFGWASADQGQIELVKEALKKHQVIEAVAEITESAKANLIELMASGDFTEDQRHFILALEEILANRDH